MSWLSENYDWLFSGIGSAIISGIVGFIYGKSSTQKSSQHIKAGDGSTNTQVATHKMGRRNDSKVAISKVREPKYEHADRHSK